MISLRAATLIVIAALGAPACTGADPEEAARTPSGSDAPAPRSSALELPCHHAIGTQVDLPDGYTAIAGAVALPTADSADRALQTSHRREHPAPNYFAKTGLLVRPGVAFTIEVDTEPRTTQLGWGSPADVGSAIAADGCDGDGWIVFAGGFLVDEPRCVEFTVRANGGEESARIGVGSPCEGQGPPPEPTDP